METTEMKCKRCLIYTDCIEGLCQECVLAGSFASKQDYEDSLGGDEDDDSADL